MPISHRLQSDARRSSPRRSIQLLAIVTAAALLAACQSETPSSPPGQQSGTPGSPGPGIASPLASSPTALGSPPPLTIPTPPSPVARPSGTVDEQAVALATAVRPSGQQALAPLLAAYAAAGIPVMGSNGESVNGTTDDLVGPPWWLVWTSAAGNPSVRMSLADAAKLTAASADTFAPDPGALAAALLADLRNMAADQNPERRFFARFVASSAAAGGADPLDPAATVDTVMLDSIGTNYLLAGLLRGAMFGLVAAQPVAFMDVGGKVASLGNWPPVREVPAAQAASNPCNPSGTAEDITFWSQWIASKIAAGAQLPGMQKATQSAVELIVKSANTAAKIGKAAAWASGLITALLFAAQLAAITAEVDVPGGLTRTKSAAHHGDEATLTATIKLDLEGSLLDGGVSVKNCLLVFLGALGIQAALPADGAVPGATVIFNGVAGIGDYWHFENASELTQDSGPDGTVRATVQGRIQRTQIAQDAPEWDREASVSVSASVEAINSRSIASTFWDSLVAPFGGIPGAIAPLIDVLKTIRWDLGVHSFLVIDWSKGWLLDQASGGGRVKGLHCGDLGGEWVINGTYTRGAGGAVQDGVQFWVANIDLATKRGTYTYTDTATMEQGGATVFIDGKAKGDATVELRQDGTVSMKLKDTEHSFKATTSLGGSGQDIPAPLQVEIIIWEPGGDCN